MEISTGLSGRVVVSGGGDVGASGVDADQDFTSGRLYVAAASSFRRCSELAFRTLWTREGSDAAYRFLATGWNLPRRGHPAGGTSEHLSEARWISRDVVVLITIAHPRALHAFVASPVEITSPPTGPYTVVACTESDRN